MARFSADLITDSGGESHASAFWDSEILLFANESLSTESILSALTFKVRRKPKDLLAHLHRIYFCYRNNRADSLYAALLDLLIVLNGRGRRISSRLIHGSRSQLDIAQISALKRAVNYPVDVQGNRYSLFSSGIVGTVNLVEIVQRGREQYDYLKLANDFIEFSQLEEAMSILEQGLDSYPEREDLQVALLELYRSTNSRERFNKRFEVVKALGIAQIEEWEVLAAFFDGKAI